MSNHFPAHKKRKTILSFYKRVEDGTSSRDVSSLPNNDISALEVEEEQPSRSQTVEKEVLEDERGVQPEEVNSTNFQRDPGLRTQIWKLPVDQRSEIRRAYIKAGPYQPILKEYPRTMCGKQFRRFQSSWFKLYPWLEYSPSKNAVFCFHCFLFETDPPKRPTFTMEGFKSWKRINSQKCSFLNHVGDHNSQHMDAVRSCEDLMRPSRHIDTVMNAQSKEEVRKNRLRLKTTISCVRWLANQACAFRGHDESSQSLNRGNFIQLVKYSASINKDIAEVVLENAPGNAKYTSPDIQKEVLHILASKVRDKIREEIGNAKYCILVDEAQDESNREQMAIVLRFVDIEGYIRERFFYIQGVENTTAMTLKKEIFDILFRYNLPIENMRGQGYDGANNMQGAWNGLQALFLKDCSSAYYVHCFAHRLQLALVAVSKEVGVIWKFYSMLNSIVNLVRASPKRHSELQSAQVAEISKKLDLDELETGRGVNQIGTLQRAGATRWSSHYRSVSSLIDMFDATCIVMDSIKSNGSGSIRGEAKCVYSKMRSFKFVFVLHLVSSIMGITEVLCQVLQQKTQDIINAMNQVRTTKTLLQELRQYGWDTFMEKVGLFCKDHNIEIPDFTARYMVGTSRSCQQHDDITVEHHYRVDIFNDAIDKQFMELTNRFPEQTMELLCLSSALDPSVGFRSLKIDDIYTLAEKFYPQDFSKHELYMLKSQLQHYKFDIPNHPDFQNISTISALCRRLVETRKSEVYYLIDRLIRLVLTLPVSTATTERSFSAMSIIKTSLRNKMENEFLRDCMIVHIERELAEDIDEESIINDFNRLKNRRVQLE